MAYQYQNWCLYKTNIQLLNGLTEDVYFFSKRKPIRGTPCDLPKKFEVVLNERIGLPYLIERNEKNNG